MQTCSTESICNQDSDANGRVDEPLIIAAESMLNGCFYTVPIEPRAAVVRATPESRERCLRCDFNSDPESTAAKLGLGYFGV
jgi:hypothetical protein